MRARARVGVRARVFVSVCDASVAQVMPTEDVVSHLDSLAATAKL